jgi:AbrB family looped-hinge helix DNA binding protein
MEPSKVGERGTVVIAAALRRRFGIEEGTLVVAEATDEGILIRPAVVVRRLWGIPETELVTSAYAVEEARRNLGTAAQRADLDALLASVRSSNVTSWP